MYAASLWRSIHRGAVFVKFRGTAALDKSRGWGIIRDEKGTPRQAVSPGYVKISSGLAAHRNRHLAEWRFLLLSFCIRIETEWPRIWNVTTKYIASPPFGAVTNRPPMYAASLCCIIYGGRFFVKFSCQGASFPPRGTIRAGGAVYSTRRIRSRQRRCSELVVRM